MATRFYLINGTPELTLGLPNGDWDTGYQASLLRNIPLSKSKSGGQIDTIAMPEGPFGSVPNRVIVLRGITDKLAAGSVFGTFNLGLGVSAINGASSYNWKIHVFIVDGNTGAFKFSLINNYTETGPSNQWTNFPQINILSIPLPTVFLSPLADGDRIVVEIGYVSRILTSPLSSGIIWHGANKADGTPAPDLAVFDSISDHAGWIEFSQDIANQPLPGQLTHVVSQVTRVAPSASARVAHIVNQTVQPPTAGPSVLTHIVVQVVPTPPEILPDVSGIYFVNPNKAAFHDSFYGPQELKIPNPTIRTALLGE